MSILHVPQEVLCCILELLEPEDLLSASGVCLEWYRSTNELMLKKRGEAIFRGGQLDLAGVSTLTVMGVLDSWAPEGFGADINDLRLGYDAGHHALQDVLIAEVMRTFPKLRSLHLRNIDITPSNAATILQEQSLLLSQLQLSFVMQRANQSNQEAIRTLSECDVLFRGLQFTVGTFTTATYPNPVDIFRLAPKTRKATVSCAGLRDSAYQCLAGSDLDELTMCSAYNLGVLGALQLASLQGLSRLSVSDADRVPSSSWQMLFRTLRTLTALRLDNCSNLCDSALTAISTMGQLRELAVDLEGCKMVTVNGFNELITRTERLERLCVRLDFDRSMLHCLEYKARNSDNLSSISIIVQRVNFTSQRVTNEIDLVKASLHEIETAKRVTVHFTEIFTKIRLQLTHEFNSIC